MSASAGKVLLTPKGDFSTSATYSILDWVRYNGGVYVAKQTTTGNLPTDTTYWEKMIDSVSTLSGLSDVNITNVADGETLIWDATNSKWVNGTISGGGSYITLTTTTEQGENVSMSIGGATYTGTFSSEGICRFEGVTETGTATISTARVTTTLEIEYFGNYVASLVYIPAHIYGVEWDGTSSPVWTRTDESANFVDPNPYYTGMSGTPSSPFDDVMPWAGMVIEERDDGLGHGGTDTMIKIPKFWYKLTQNGAGLKIQIADAETPGFSVSPAHMDRGDGKGERDTVYIGRYKCIDGTCKSEDANPPYVNCTRAIARTSIRNTHGANFWQQDFAMRFTIWLLYLVEFADWNSQKTIGLGCGNNSSAEYTGRVWNMPYHTGTIQTSRTTYGAGTQYRYIEGLWDSCFEWIDGCYNDSNGLNIILNPSNFSDSAGGILVGTPSNGLPSAFTKKEVSGTFPMFIPTEANSGDSSFSSYSCDNWSYHENRPCISGGAYYSRATMFGLFCISRADISDAVASIGCRLMELPDNT